MCSGDTASGLKSGYAFYASNSSPELDYVFELPFDLLLSASAFYIESTAL